jgi:hypothetical protein
VLHSEQSCLDMLANADKGKRVKIQDVDEEKQQLLEFSQFAENIDKAMSNDSKEEADVMTDQSK